MAEQDSAVNLLENQNSEGHSSVVKYLTAEIQKPAGLVVHDIPASQRQVMSQWPACATQHGFALKTQELGCTSVPEHLLDVFKVSGLISKGKKKKRKWGRREEEKKEE